jgi:hypothetical protein
MTTTHASTEQRADPYVLPAARRPPAEVIVVQPVQGAALMRGGDVARALGDRFSSLAECQQQFLGELRERLEAIDSAAADDSRARLKGSLREALRVLDWCDAVQSDLANDSRRAATGFEPIRLADIARLVAAEPTEHDGVIHVAGEAVNPWWGSAVELAELIRLGLTAVSERTGGTGSRVVEVGSIDGAPWIRIAGAGEPGRGLAPATLERFRRSADQLGARVVPDVLGPGGAGLVLHLPAGR